ncbi:class III extradiol ring-cleavage dioxygenase [Parvibaculum sp.]|uniref:DODA-type extradiol aromatic ring-opening family dioxygenase n=1 Tax=Parvibaculum sp. TaxID=2024848 RepID=UPI002CC0DD68|nr:class III extradiol ring-cleavage dioxygenase [Parvibaculum sp.]HUD51861.1 class III extradiol ring-cleavage dioxygenase [Parvibaculum sp.]
MTRTPSLFISHGSPMLAFEDGPARRFLTELAPRLRRPRAVLVVSAHYEEEHPTVTTGAAPGTIHDFYGFPPALHRLVYPAPGAPEIAKRVLEVLAARGYEVTGDAERGFDHGAWVPMILINPYADIPLIQLSISPHRDAAWHYALGEALRPLRDEDILIVGSGSITHNLRDLTRSDAEAAPSAWASEFTEWIYDKVATGALDDLLHYRERAPNAVHAHPTDEHFMPFFVALGASLSGESAERLHHSFTYGALGMDVYAFGEMS